MYDVICLSRMISDPVNYRGDGAKLMKKTPMESPSPWPDAECRLDSLLVYSQECWNIRTYSACAVVSYTAVVLTTSPAFTRIGSLHSVIELIVSQGLPSGPTASFPVPPYIACESHTTLPFKFKVMCTPPSWTWPVVATIYPSFGILVVGLVKL